MISVSHPTGILKGTVQLPSSKSISNRALIIRAIAGYDFLIDDLSQSTDTLTLLKLLIGNHAEYHCNDGGTTFRFLLGLKSFQNESCIITGSERMQQRPIQPLVDALNSMGADISYLKNDGFPPIKLNSGLLHDDQVSIDASVSSQFISSLMMIAPQLENGLKILLTGEIVSWEYILLTKNMMNYFGVEVDIGKNYIYIPNKEYIVKNIVVEKDWSAASYWFEAAALSKETDLILEGLNLNSMQGDERIVSLIKPFGVEVMQEENGLRIIKKTGKTLPQKFEFNFINHPDLVQTMAFLCATERVEARFNGIQSLRIKETDRVEAIKILVTKFGSDVIVANTFFSIKSSTKINEYTDSLPVFNDHRMAMSLAPLSLTFGKLNIEDHLVVNKSYPTFWEELKMAGFHIY